MDELSDDEGDEEAGDIARAKDEMKRDKKQTRDIIDAVVYGKDKFKNLRNQGLLNEDERELKLREDGALEDDENGAAEDDEAYFAQIIKEKEKEDKKERQRMEEERIEEEKEAEEEAESKKSFYRFIPFV